MVDKLVVVECTDCICKEKEPGLLLVMEELESWALE